MARTRERENARTDTKDQRVLNKAVVYLAAADKYRGLTCRPSQGQKVLDERTLMASQRPLVVYLSLTDNSRVGECGKIVSFHHWERGCRHGTAVIRKKCVYFVYGLDLSLLIGSLGELRSRS